jgi:hypothetical protein
MPSPRSGISIAHPPPGERANKERLMAEERDPGLDNQERPERDPMEQGYESSQNSRRFDLPEQDTEDDGEQSPSDEETH